MAVSKPRRLLQEFILPPLRRLHGPYRLLRKIYRVGKSTLIETARACFRRSQRIGPPLGWFSCWELLQKGDVKGEILLSGQTVPTASLDSMRKISDLGQGGYQPWPIFWSYHSNVTLFGRTLVIMDQHKRANVEGMFGQPHGDPAYSSFYRQKAVKLGGNWTSIVSNWCLSGSYYHWFLDGITRLAMLPHFPPDTRILVPAKQLHYERDTIRMLGLEDRIRRTPEKHLQLENYYFSAPSAMTGCCNPLGIEFLRSNLLPHADPDFWQGEKLYLLRKGHTRYVLNQDEVIEFLSKAGWTVIEPEKLSLAQQIATFSNARAVCGAHGSAFTNLLWSKPGCFVLELFPSNFLNGCYESIAACIGLDYHYLICDSDSGFRMKVDLAKLAALLPK